MLSPQAISDDVEEEGKGVLKVNVEGLDFLVFPHVYPSHKFRTTDFILKNLKNLVKGKKIIDMGCGPGVVGLYSLENGASFVIQADINSYAVENAIENNLLHGFGEEQVQTYKSDCFDNIPEEIFDIIVFNMPYHSDEIEIDKPIKYAFYDPKFSSIKKFLIQAKNYLDQSTQIFIAFSNKGDITTLEKIFSDYKYDWSLWRITNEDQEYDNRMYRLTLKQ